MRPPQAVLRVQRGRADHVTVPGCRSITAATVDPPVAGCLLTALSGQEVELTLTAADQVTERRTRAVRAAELAVERARYEAGGAERALLACEPENRLVARALKARLEAKLGELAEAQAALATVTAAKPPLPPARNWKPPPPPSAGCGRHSPPPAGTGNGCCAP